MAIMRVCSPRRLLGPWLLCLCWPRGAAGVEAAGSVEISPKGAALPVRPRRAKVMRRERHASLTTDGVAVGVGHQGATDKFEENQDGDPADDDVEPRGGEENEELVGNRKGQEDGEEKGEPVSLDDEGREAEKGEEDPEENEELAGDRKGQEDGEEKGEPPVSLDDEGGEAEGGEEDPEDGTGPSAGGEDGQGGEPDDAPALVKAPFHFVHVSGPANRVCKGHSLWTGKAADEDECEQKCADLEACRFISLSSSNWCRLTATCDSTWRQDGKKVWIFSRSGPALAQAATTTEATPEPTEAETTTEATPEPTEAETTTEASGTDASSTDDKDNASNTTEVLKVNATDNTTDNTTNGTEVPEVLKVNATDNATDNTTNGTEVLKINASSASKEDVFAQQCQDQADPGIEFVNGTTATCPMLRHYCHHPQFGELVRDNCPKACGFCAVELEENSTDNKSNGSTCRDGEPSDLPRYEEAGHALSCNVLRHYCELDVSVKMKCKRTCGWCDNPGEPLRPGTELTKANKTNATSKPDDDTAEGWGITYNACSRRRLLGYCHTRRRRVA